MRIGHVIVTDDTEWTVVRTDENGFPTSLRAKGNKRKIHLGTVIRNLDTIVKSKTFDADEGCTQIELFPRQLFVSAQSALNAALR